MQRRLSKHRRPGLETLHRQTTVQNQYPLGQYCVESGRVFLAWLYVGFQDLLRAKQHAFFVQKATS